MVLRLLADKLVELQYTESISHETVRRVLKKRVEALEGNWMGNTPSSKQVSCDINGQVIWIRDLTAKTFR